MWSDPDDIDTWGVSQRGAGWLFGSKVTSEVNLTHSIYEFLIRISKFIYIYIKTFIYNIII